MFSTTEPFQELDYLTDFKQHALSSPTKECCGLVVEVKGVLIYKPCTNIAEKDYDFTISPLEYAYIESLGEIKYICHSHLDNSAKPSDVDRTVCNYGTVPWLIFSIKSFALVTMYPGELEVPLIGRQYKFGILDCYGLAQDMYKEHLGIEIGRPQIEEAEWFKHKTNLLEEYAATYGFSRVADMKEFDLILFKAGDSKIPNHVGVKTEGITFIHHLAHRLSTKEVYGGYWQKCTVGIYRHKDLI